MYNFKAKVHHDNGDIMLHLVAKTVEDAYKHIMKAEKCPRRAIKWIYAYGVCTGVKQK